MISQSAIEGMRARMPEVLEHYGIQQTARSFKAFWRGDDNPSCTYYPDTNLLYDFGEGFTYDVFSLVGRVEGLDEFPAQARRVSEILGCSLDETAGKAGRRKKARPRFEVPSAGGFRDLDIMENCQRAFVDLYHTKEGAPALEYLYRRGFKDADIVRYGFGFVKHPRDLAACFTYIDPKKPRGYVVIPFPTSREYSSVHYARLRAIAGGQEPTQKEVGPTGVKPPLFHEYLLAEPLQAVFVAEGPFDAIAAEIIHKAPCIGLGGVAMSKRIGRILALVPPDMRPQRFVLALDNDEPGRKAAANISADLKALHIPCTVLDMPEGCKDPNDILRKKNEA